MTEQEAETSLQVEADGETVGEAKWSALRELERRFPGIDKASVQFVVISEGERGLLGVGYTPARVIASVSALAAAPPAEEEPGSAAARLRELVERITAALGAPVAVAIREDDEALVATLSGPDLGLVIGKHGQTIDAIQYLANAILARQVPGIPVVVDAAGYRARREATLASLATGAAEQALRSGDRIELEPMTAVERKIVHVTLQDYSGVETSSEGTEPNRFVVVSPSS
jgi:spoIIIJ-associated protein